MKKIMVIFGILAMVWFQSCRSPYDNIDLENEGQNNGTVTEQTNGENQNDNGNNEDSNNEENGQDENQQAEHVRKDYFEIEVGEDWSELTYVAILIINDEESIIYDDENYYSIDGVTITNNQNNKRIFLFLRSDIDYNNRLFVTSNSNSYQVYDVIRNGNIVTIELK